MIFKYDNDAVTPCIFERWKLKIGYIKSYLKFIGNFSSWLCYLCIYFLTFLRKKNAYQNCLLNILYWFPIRTIFVVLKYLLLNWYSIIYCWLTDQMFDAIFFVVSRQMHSSWYGVNVYGILRGNSVSRSIFFLYAGKSPLALKDNSCIPNTLEPVLKLFHNWMKSFPCSKIWRKKEKWEWRKRIIQLTFLYCIKNYSTKNLQSRLFYRMSCFSLICVFVDP